MSDPRFIEPIGRVVRIEGGRPEKVELKANQPVWYLGADYKLGQSHFIGDSGSEDKETGEKLSILSDQPVAADQRDGFLRQKERILRVRQRGRVMCRPDEINNQGEPLITCHRQDLERLNLGRGQLAIEVNKQRKMAQEVAARGVTEDMGVGDVNRVISESGDFTAEDYWVMAKMFYDSAKRLFSRDFLVEPIPEVSPQTNPYDFAAQVLKLIDETKKQAEKEAAAEHSVWFEESQKIQGRSIHLPGQSRELLRKAMLDAGIRVYREHKQKMFHDLLSKRKKFLEDLGLLAEASKWYGEAKAKE